MNIEYDHGAVNIGSQSFLLNEMWKQYVNQTGTNQLLFGIRPEHIELSPVFSQKGVRGQVKYIENRGITMVYI